MLFIANFLTALKNKDLLRRDSFKSIQVILFSLLE
jgi:hypothetical protein